MLDISKDIQSLTGFKRNTPACLDKLRETGRVLVLTVNGKAEVVTMSATTFQKMREALATRNSVEAARR